MQNTIEILNKKLVELRNVKKSAGGKVIEEDEENQGIKKTEKDFIEETAKIRYQNVLLISRLEQSEEVENELKKEIWFLRDKIAKSKTEEDKRKKSKEEVWISKESQYLQNAELIDQLDIVTNERNLLKTNIEQLEKPKDQLEIIKEEKNKLKAKLQEVKNENHVMRSWKEEAMKCRRRERERGYRNADRKRMH